MTCFLSSFVKIHSAVVEKKSKNVSANQRPGRPSWISDRHKLDRSRLPPFRDFPRFSFVKVTTLSKLHILKLNFESYMQLTDIIQPLSKSLQLCL